MSELSARRTCWAAACMGLKQAIVHNRVTDRMQPKLMNGSRKKSGTPPSLTTEGAYERIWSAIMDHSLPPETRLVEQRLCEIFGIGRTRLRQVLQRLAHERVVTLMPNRGAVV